MTIYELRAQQEAKELPKRMQPYSGSFPRKRHSHYCEGCARKYGQVNSVACYKQRCARAQHVETCSWCYRGETALSQVGSEPKTEV